MLVQPAIRPALAADAFERACNLDSAAGCANRQPERADRPMRSAPELADYAIVLRFRRVRARRRLRWRSIGWLCDQGFADGCRQACDQGYRNACSSVRRGQE